MLSNIKSLEILKKIFSSLRRNYSLKLINYNKSLQSKLSLDINNYKEYAKIYRVFDKDGKVKEYDMSTNELKFEGENKNKKRSGLGKEYKKGKLIYEGEYKDGLRNGYGKKYDEKKANWFSKENSWMGKNGKEREWSKSLKKRDYYIYILPIFMENSPRVKWMAKVKR